MDANPLYERTALMAAFIVSPIVARDGSRSGALAHHSASCSCGLEMASTMISSLRLDVAEHLRWHERKAAR